MNFFRIIKASIKNFFRNLWLSLSTFTIMTLALLLVGGLILLNASVNMAGEWLENKVDISVFFQEEANEAQILEYKDFLEENPQVESVEYQSKEKALEEQIRLAEEIDDQTVLQGIEIVEGNPYQASLRINAKNISDFSDIEDYVRSLPDSNTLIDTIGSDQNKLWREKLDDWIVKANYGILIFITALSIFVFLVTYNTIRLSIYTSRDEIGIMKLVGASNWFVRGPFIVTGFFYGFFSSFIAIVILIGATYQAGVSLAVFSGEINLYKYLIEHIIYIYPALLGVGLFMGVVSSFIAVRRYLKV